VYNQDPATRGKFDTVYDNNDALNENYNGVDIVAQKRMANHWMLMGSLTFESTNRDINTNSQTGFNQSDFNNPNFTFRRGPSDTDLGVFTNINAAYEAPWNLKASTNIQVYRGAPLLTQVQVTSATVTLTQGNQTINVAEFGDTRLPVVKTVDFQLT